MQLNRASQLSDKDVAILFLCKDVAILNCLAKSATRLSFKDGVVMNPGGRTRAFFTRPKSPDTTPYHPSPRASTALGCGDARCCAA